LLVASADLMVFLSV